MGIEGRDIVLFFPPDAGFEAFLARGKGTEGGFVVERRAAKKRHSAGPTRVHNVR